MGAAQVALLVLLAGTLSAAAERTCTPGSELDTQQALLARYIYELRNNRQKDCSPPDFVQNAAEQGFIVKELCTEPGPEPSDTYTNLTASFKDSCKQGSPETEIKLETLVRLCPGQDPTLQPWEASSVSDKVEPLPANFACPAGLEAIPVVDDEIYFTPMWEFNHLCENSVKYKLFPADPSALPNCGGAAYLTTTMQRACYNASTGEYDGYCKIQFTCEDGKTQDVSVHAAGKTLGRANCPWPMFLRGSDGYDPAFDFLNQTSPPPGPAPVPAPGPIPGDLAACLAAASIEFVDGSSPAALEEASKVWNKLNDTTPAAVAYPADADQVAAAVLCAKEAGIKPVARTGGHSYMGYSVMPNDLTIDLNRMNTTTVADDGETATVQAGSRLGQLYYWVYNQTSGAKSAVGGTCPTVGTSGLFLGGGIGTLTRQFGLACDQLVEVHMVDAEGQLLVANSEQNAEVLAATCGVGGGNLGIVTEFRIKLHDAPPLFTIASYTVAPSKALQYLNFVQSDWLPRGSSNTSLQLNIATDGIEVLAQYPGPKKEAQKLLAAEGLVGAGTSWTVSDESWQEMPWINTVVTQAFYPSVKQPSDLLNIRELEAEYRTYFKLKSFLVMEPVSDEAWRTMIEWEAKIEKYGGYIELDMLGPQSAVAAVAPNATGFVHRGALFSMQYGAEWPKGGTTNKVLPLIEQMQAALEPFFAPALPAYINYEDVQVGPTPLESYYGQNIGWLQDLKSQLDPTNLFTANPLNIPAGDSPSPAPAPAPGPAPSPASPSPEPSPAPAPAPSPSSGATAPAQQGVLAMALALLVGTAVIWC